MKQWALQLTGQLYWLQKCHAYRDSTLREDEPHLVNFLVN